MDNYLIFDVSSPTILYCGKTDREFFVQKEFTKGKMNRELPDLITDIKSRLNKNTKVITGTGPGSFTGLKTGISMFIGMLYSLGITKIYTLSSLKLFSQLCEKETDYILTVSPFNRDEFFFSVFDSSGNCIIPDRHTCTPHSELSEAAANVKNKTIQIVSCEKLENRIMEQVSKIFANPVFSPISMNNDFQADDLKEIDLTKDLLLLNYVAFPANISDSVDIYVNNKRGTT